MATYNIEASTEKLELLTVVAREAIAKGALEGYTGVKVTLRWEYLINPDVSDENVVVPFVDIQLSK